MKLDFRSGRPVVGVLPSVTEKAIQKEGEETLRKKGTGPSWVASSMLMTRGQGVKMGKGHVHPR